MTKDGRTGKDLEGNGHGQMEVRRGNLPEGIDGNREGLRRADVPGDTGSERLSTTSLPRYL